MVTRALKLQTTFVVSWALLVISGNLSDISEGHKTDNERKNPEKLSSIAEKLVDTGDRNGPTNIDPNARFIKPENVPWMIQVLDEDNFCVSSGGLVTWNKVLTTCKTANDTSIKFVKADFGGVRPQLRNVKTVLMDNRCRMTINSDNTMLRYNVGIITVDRPFSIYNYTINVVQFPTLNKRKYQELTDQLTRSGTTCRFFVWNGDELTTVAVTAIESYRILACQNYEGIHEFICSYTLDFVDTQISILEGSPVVCGEDVYGILTIVNEQHELMTTNGSSVYIWLRLDEFVHLIVNDNKKLIQFIHNVES